MTIKRTAVFTDIHFGKRSNSIVHNQDCLDFLSFFSERVKEDGKITHLVFMGDWFENRNAINVLTMDYAHQACSILNGLGLPIIFIIGNHDLYHRESRKVFSTRIFDEFKNIQVVSEPTVIDETLFCPFLFREEYSQLAKYNNLPIWYGHFEFRNFMLTGSNMIMDKGPEHTQFKGPTYIFSGHYHKRQAVDNVVYMGNCFPTDFGDAGDNERGMMIVDHETMDVDFIDWAECPTFVKTTLNKVATGEVAIKEGARVRCLLDLDITYSEAQTLKEEFTKAYNLREFVIEENMFEKKDALMEGGDIELDDLELSGLDETVKLLLETGVQTTTTIDPKKLIEIYNEL